MAGACRLAQGRSARTGDKDQPGQAGIRQAGYRRRIPRALPFQPRQRAKARCIARAGFQKAQPRAGQAQQADGLPGGGGVEDYMVVAAEQGFISQQPGELVKGGDFGCAGHRQLRLDPLDRFLRQAAPDGPEPAVAVGLSRNLGVGLQQLHRLLRQIDAAHPSALRRQPVQISGEIHQLLINFRAADACETAHRRIVHDERDHWSSFGKQPSGV